MGLFDDLYTAVSSKASEVYSDAKDDLGDWWNSTEDSEELPKTYAQQAQNERLAEGSALPVVHTATTNTGQTVPPASTSAFDNYQPWLIGGGVLVVVLLVFALLLRGGK